MTPTLDPRPAALIDTAPLAALLAQTADAVAALDPRQYVQCPVGHATSSIGAHVRHVLDHAHALLRAPGTGVADYESRERGGVLETQRDAGRDALRAASAALARLTAALDLPLVVTARQRPDEPPLQLHSTLGREVAFVLGHTVHHQALIALALRALGLPVAAEFGRAPSTLAHDATGRERPACVR